MFHARTRLYPPPDDNSDGGYFDVSLVLIGSEDGRPYTKEISFSDSNDTITVDVSYLLDTVDIELSAEVAGASIKVDGRSLDYGQYR